MKKRNLERDEMSSDFDLLWEKKKGITCDKMCEREEGMKEGGGDGKRKR